MRTCNKCGKEITADKVVTHKPCMCRDCYNRYNREYRKRRADKMEAETGYRQSESEREYKNAYCTKQRIKAKMETGRTYRSEKEAERARKYAKAHIKKTSELTKEQHERRKKNGRRYWERKKMIEFVDNCSALDLNDFDDVL